jgi:CheY-like chemotaxis protein
MFGLLAWLGGKTADGGWQRREAPEAARPVPVACPTDPAVAAAPGRRVPVLVVDDEESVHLLVATSLRDDPFEVLSAGDTAQADEILARRPDIGVVICDECMPVEDGFTFLGRLRRERPRVRTMLVSGYASDEVASSADLAARVDRFLAKPWRPAEFREAVRALAGVPGAGGA